MYDLCYVLLYADKNYIIRFLFFILLMVKYFLILFFKITIDVHVIFMDVNFIMLAISLIISCSIDEM